MLKKLLIISLFTLFASANTHFEQAVLAYKSGNKTKAAELFQTACSNNHAISCYNLAVMSKIGDGITTDLQKAVPLLKKACEANIYKACYNLGIIYNEGEGVIVDKQQSEKYLDIACDNYFGHACFLLGYSYLIGDSGVQDKLLAKKYFTKCCDISNEDCCKYKRQLTKEGY
jgi:TPR repeat protein